MKKIFLLLFFFFIYTPIILFFLSLKIDIDFIKNIRTTQWTTQIEKNFSETFILKSVLTKKYNSLSLFLFNYARRSNVLRGKKGWLFYTVGLTNHKNRLPYTATDLTNLKNILSLHQQTLANENIVLISVVAPDKQTIYEDYLPQNPSLMLNPRLSQRTQALSEYQEIHEILLTPILKSAAESQQVYYKYDTHWNTLGSFLAYQAIMKKVQEFYPEIEVLEKSDFDIEEIQKNERSDLSRILLDGKQINETDFLFSLNDSGREKLSENKKIDLAYIYQDSFFSQKYEWGTTHFLSLHFRKVETFEAPEVFDINKILENTPNIVIKETVERHL